ncbi:tail protein X [Paracandidimonas soli]|uniref:Phage tail protein X n=1 Tax=Paracandidimonas soli TaxID=1917182 RepID=A0A4R3V6A4_9BURK|nr:tail protein X [Paracandidimonas soli]TCV00506.1 phage tail protein X [Paracandidimonas soli]
MIVHAQKNDTVDALCWRYLGETRDIVEQAYELNPGLADQGPILAHGTPVVLPDAVRLTSTVETVKLWD